MGSIRTFVALELPPAIQDGLRQISAHLQTEAQGLPLRWVPIENIHLTLKFIGDTAEANIKPISDLLQTKAKSIPAFDVSLDGLGIFPNPRRPNVIWVGLDAPKALFDLQKQLELDLSSMGFAPEKRPFSPHLTVARVRRVARPADLSRISDMVASAQIATVAAGRIDTLTLFRSELKPGGSVYNALSRSPLASAV